MHRGLKHPFVPFAAMCVLLASVVVTTVIANRANAQMPYVGSSDDTPTAPRRDSSVTFVSIANEPRMDTIYVFDKHRALTKKIAVSRYYEIHDDIAFPFRRMLYVGTWSELVVLKLGAVSSSYRSGVWKSFGSVPFGEIRLELHAQDGSVGNITPASCLPRTDKHPKTPKTAKSTRPTAPSDTTRTSFHKAMSRPPAASLRVVHHSRDVQG